MNKPYGILNFAEKISEYSDHDLEIYNLVTERLLNKFSESGQGVTMPESRDNGSLDKFIETYYADFYAQEVREQRHHQTLGRLKYV